MASQRQERVWVKISLINMGVNHGCLPIRFLKNIAFDIFMLITDFFAVLHFAP